VNPFVGRAAGRPYQEARASFWKTLTIIGEREEAWGMWV
jgi:hypothetical protein